MLCRRLLIQTQEKGAFLARDSSDGTRQILSFLSGDGVCHVYVDHNEYLCKLGKLAVQSAVVRLLVILCLLTARR